jgi:hypothetical protein
MSYRIPANEEYCKELGRAVYNFAYWEWIILWTIETLENGFLNEYRHAKMPSGGVAKRLQKAIQNKKHDLTSAIHS